MSEGKEEVKAITMNAASLLESFPKTKMQRIKANEATCAGPKPDGQRHQHAGTRKHRLNWWA